jgi:hypothetical protein
VLAAVVDPRARRGVRHPLVVVLGAAVCAVAAGAQSYVAIAEWVADLPDHAAAGLGLGRRCPCESTIRRVVQRLDGDRFDAAISTWIQQLSATCTPTGRRRAVAVDGKALRGARTADRQQHPDGGNRPPRPRRAWPDRDRRQDQRGRRIRPAA